MGRYRNRLAEAAAKIVQGYTYICGLLAIGLVVATGLSLFGYGLPALFTFGPGATVFGAIWAPQQGQYGFLPLILSSLSVTLTGVLLAVPLAVLLAVFCVRVLPGRFAGPVGLLLAVLDMVPSTLFGLIGIVLVVPFLRDGLGFSHGESLAAAIVVMALIALPRLASLFSSALRSVPRDVQLAGYALGATKEELWFFLELRHVGFELANGLLINVGVLLGEALPLMMVAGGIANMPALTKGTVTLAMGIFGEAFNADAELRGVLFLMALVFECFLLVIVRGVHAALRKGRQL